MKLWDKQRHKDLSTMRSKINVSCRLVRFQKTETWGHTSLSFLSPRISCHISGCRPWWAYLFHIPGGHNPNFIIKSRLCSSKWAVCVIIYVIHKLIVCKKYKYHHSKWFPHFLCRKIQINYGYKMYTIYIPWSHKKAGATINPWYEIIPLP